VLRLLTSVPALAYLLVFMAIPLVLIISYAFLTSGRFGGVRPPITLDNVARLTEPLYVEVLFTSILTAGAATLLAFAIGFPAALAITRLSPKWQTIALIAVVLPFWTNFLIRTYAWIVLLNREGLINDGLALLGQSRIDVLYTRNAVVLGLMYAYLPLMVLPIYASLQRLDPSLLEAARNLGAGGWRRFRTVLLPLTMPGILTGCLFVFIPSLGNFVIPELLGGGNSQMIGNLIRDQFLKSRDWPFGSALSLLVLALLLIIVMLQSRAARRMRRWSA
jgi:spermidine/putrescine transport system permease protein